MTDGRTHHATCWRGHLDCAARRIEELEALLRDLRDRMNPELDEVSLTYHAYITDETRAKLAALRLSTDCEECQNEREPDDTLCYRHRHIRLAIAEDEAR